MKKIYQVLIGVISVCIIITAGVFIWNTVSRDNDSHETYSQLKSIQQNDVELSRLDRRLFKYMDLAKSNSPKLNSLLDSIAFLSNRIALLHQQNALLTSQAKTTMGAVVDSKMSLQMIDAVKSVLHLLISVPFLLLLVILGLVSGTISMDGLYKLLGNFRSIEAFGAKVELNEKAKADLEGTMQDYQQAVTIKYDLWQQRRGIRNKVGEIAKKLKVENFFTNDQGVQVDDLRFTLHVPDLLFKNRVYQLTDYWPGGDGHGRTWSVRFGILGLAWRSENDQLKGNIPTDPDELIRNWGMTKEEAEERSKQSLAAVVLKSTDDQHVLGVFYIDSGHQNAFGDQAHMTLLCNRIKQLSVSTGLIQSLKDINKELMSDTLLLDF